MGVNGSTGVRLRAGGNDVTTSGSWALFSARSIAAPSARGVDVSIGGEKTRLALAALVRVAARRAPRGLSVVVVACVVQTGLIVVSLVSMLRDESSTAVLLLLFLPVYMLVLLLPFVGLTALVHRVRSRPRR